MNSLLDVIISVVAFFILAAIGFILVAAGNELGLAIQACLIVATFADLLLIVRSES